MRRFRAIAVAVLPAVLLTAGVPASAQGCTNLACNQLPVNSCLGTTTTTISGTVYAPNGTDPLPNVLVYIPNAITTPLPPFPPVVACVLPGATPDGSPLVGTITGVDGSFTIGNVPVGTNIPLVALAGRWRRQTVVDTTVAGACGNTVVPSASIRMPKNQSEGDIPKIAVATGSADQVECVLRKVGVEDAEFTNPGGTGRINLYRGSNSPGSYIDGSTPSASVLMGSNDPTNAVLDSYDVLMLPCEGGQYTKTPQELTNLVSFANAGGRVYSSHYSYIWMYQNPPFNGVAQWSPKYKASFVPDPDIATVNTSFSDGNTLAQWLQLPAISASVAPDEMQISTLRQDLQGVNSPTQSWLTLNEPGNPIMQFVFNTPVGNAVTNQCGRVLFNEYHVENPSAGSPSAFPNGCSNAVITPQEKLLEYSLFALTADGNAATLTPATQDFGSKFVTFASAPQIFTWTNQSVFSSSVSLLSASGDFAVTGNNCTNVAPNGSCQITVMFTPTAVGARSGTLTVGAPGSTLTASLTGTGLSPFSLSTASMTFPGVVIGATDSQTFSLTNAASISFALPTINISGDYSYTSVCANPVPANSSCIITVIFAPQALGTRTGTLTVNAPGNSLPVALTGTGLPSFTLSPAMLIFSNVDIGGGTASETATLTSVAPIALPLPAISMTGDYGETSNCPNPMPANSSCTITVIFAPTVTGTRTGTLSVAYGAGSLTTLLTGNGVDFTILVTPTSGSVIAGFSVTSVITTAPIAGFNAPITLSCTSITPGSSCIVSLPQFTLNAQTDTPFTITTTSQYTVVGYTGGVGGGSWLWLFAVGGGLLIFRKRRSAGLARIGMLMALLTAGFALNGCSGKLPAQNDPYTAPGSHTYMLTATDGILTHSATYTLSVSVK